MTRWYVFRLNDPPNLIRLTHLSSFSASFPTALSDFPVASWYASIRAKSALRTSSAVIGSVLIVWHYREISRQTQEQKREFSRWT